MAFGTVPVDVPACEDLSVLAPRFAEKVRLLLEAMAAQGLPSRVAETLRTTERQAFLYGFGRFYDDGRGTVTNAATTNTTWHGYGLAVDIVHAVMQWDAPESYWIALRDTAERVGLASGARWTTKDRPHVQWTPMRVTPSVNAVTLRADGGLPAVWRAVGAA